LDVADLSPSQDKPGRSTWVVGLCLFVWLSFTAWMRPLAVPDEGRYAGVAWEMIRSGDWLTPTLNGLPFFHKPPLFYWLTGLSLSTFGLNVWAARLASVLGALMAAWTLYVLVKRWAGERLATWSALVLVSQPFFFGGAQYANLDMLVGGCIAATVVVAAQAVLACEAGLPYRRALWGAYALAGLGLLAKGLIGLVLPGGVMVIWLLLTGRWRQLLTLLSLPGLLVLAVVAAPWFVAMQRLYPDFFHYFFVYQHFQRFTQTGFNNMHPFWYYLPLIVGLTLPWVPAALVAWIQSPRQVAPSSGPDGFEVGRRTLRQLMWVWMGVVVLFFSIPASKLPGYVLPALPPLAFLVADAVLRRWPAIGARVPRALAAVALVLCPVLIGVVAHVDKQGARPAAPQIQSLLSQGVPLVYVDKYFYDLPFYLARTEPVPMFSDWADPKLPLSDNDRKELADAGEFRPEVAQRLLLSPAAWRAWLCSHERLVVVAKPRAAENWPELGWQAPVETGGDFYSVWVLQRAVLQTKGLVCP
jgi:4-amino-4-deoxy-L-arabinose transferase-like glycosyltransferase